MENIIIKTDPDSPFLPSVNFDIKAGVCTLQGESYMENSFQFYTPLLEWINYFCTEIRRSLTFNFKLTYFNTSSSRLILEILDLLKEYKENGGDIKIFWFCTEDDLDMRDEVEDFEAEVGIDINFKFVAKT